MALSDNTGLVISGVDLPPYSARGLSQTLTWIQQASRQARTVNGDLVDISNPNFRKFASEISGADQQPPPADLYPGLEVVVDCVATLSFKTSGGAAIRTIAESWADGDFTIYRPRLRMRVLGLDIQRDEWGAAVSWTLRLEEV